MKTNRVIYLKKSIINDVAYHFLLLHHFKIENSQYFKTQEEILFGQSKNKYSILGYLDDSFKVKNKFVFLMEYPEGDCAIFFEQDINPVIAEPDQFVNMKNRGLECLGNIPFSGLTRSTTESRTFIDGVIRNESQNRIWYYPIGQKQGNGGDIIPSYSEPQNPKITEVNLWIQIEDFSLLSRFKSILTCKPSIKFTHLTLFLYVNLMS